MYTGDIRRCLQLAKRAVEISKDQNEGLIMQEAEKVNYTHVLAAFGE